MFNPGQIAAVRTAFALAGYHDELRTFPVDSEDERLFVVPVERVAAMGDIRGLEHVVTQLIGRKVAVLVDRGYATVPFA